MFQIKAVEKIKGTFLFNNLFSTNRAIYEIMWKNTVEPGRPQMAIWWMCIACWLPKATKTCSEYVILIAFARQQWFHERSSMLRYMCITCLVSINTTTASFLILTLHAHGGNFQNLIYLK